MEVMFLVDLHWSGSKPLTLPDLNGVDLVLLGGDLTHFGGAAQARKVVEAIQNRGPQVLAVAGNCDYPEVEQCLAEMGVGLDCRVVEIEGAVFAGLSGGLPFGGCPYERTEEDYRQACSSLPSDFPQASVMVSHQPPKDTACDLTRGGHVGSQAIRDYILSAKPTLVLSGHIHESIGQDTLGPSRLANPGPWAAKRFALFSVAQDSVGPVRLEHRA